jgi:hypothetical protein
MYASNKVDSIPENPTALMNKMIESKQKENEVLNPIENKNIDTYSDNVSTIIITPSDVEPSQNYIYRG